MSPSTDVIYRATLPARFFCNTEYILWSAILLGVGVGEGVVVAAQSTVLGILAGFAAMALVPIAVRYVFGPRSNERFRAALCATNERGLYVATVGGAFLTRRSHHLLTGAELRKERGLLDYTLVEPFERGRPEHAELLEEAVREDTDDLAETLRDEERLVERLATLGIPDPTAVAKATSTYSGTEDE